MKIQGDGDLLGRVRIEHPVSPAAPAASRFEEILKERLNQAAASEPATASNGAVSVRFQPADPAPAGSLISQLQGFLDLMSDYRSKLADPRVSLKGLEPVVRSLEQGRDALSPLLGSLPEGEGLRDILNQALVTTEMEIIRFRRGDYLPA
jgi:hypothetical protein